VRQQGASRVFAVFNLSSAPQQVRFTLARHHGAYTDALTNEAAEFAAETPALSLAPWGFRLFRLNAANPR
jgi:hypothetical protein